MLERRSDEELSQLAKDIEAKQVFTSAHVPDSDTDMLMSIFMPLGLGGLGNMKEEDAQDIGIAYEYYGKAGPMAINGYPTFFSCSLLGKADTKIVFEKVAKIRELLATV